MNRWDQRYASGEYGHKPPDPLLVQVSLIMPPGRALDLACGDGRHSTLLAERGWQVIAVDYSSEALSRIAESPHIQKVLADIEAGEFVVPPQEFDLVIDTSFLYRPLFPAIQDGIKPGGVFAGIFPLEGINPQYLLERGELSRLFAGWEFIHFDESSRRAEILARKPALPVH